MEITKVILQEDGTFIFNDTLNVPDNSNNRHRVMIQEWIDAGNTPTPYSAPVKAWDQKRREAYSDIREQLDMQYKDLVNDTTVWKDHIAKVKSDIPKE